MTTERKHPCGGELLAREVQVVFDESDNISLSYRAQGFICNKCHEQVIDSDTALHLQASQTPAIAWYPGRVDRTWPDAVKFDPFTAGTAKEALV